MVQVPTLLLITHVTRWGVEKLDDFNPLRFFTITEEKGRKWCRVTDHGPPAP